MLGGGAVLLACGGGNKTHARRRRWTRRSKASTSPTSCARAAPSCATTGDGVLKVGAGKRIYTPQNFETYTDENSDRQWESTEPYTDLNGNGKFDGVWLFGGGRAAMGVNDRRRGARDRVRRGRHDGRHRLHRLHRPARRRHGHDPQRPAPRRARTSTTSSSARRTRTTRPTRSACGARRRRRPAASRSSCRRSTTPRSPRSPTRCRPRSPRSMMIASTQLINDPDEPDVEDRRLEPGHPRSDHLRSDADDRAVRRRRRRRRRRSARSSTGPTTPRSRTSTTRVPATITAHYPHWLREHIENGVLDDARAIYAPTDLPGLGGITVFVQGALGGQIGSIRGTHAARPRRHADHEGVARDGSGDRHERRGAAR